MTAHSPLQNFKPVQAFSEKWGISVRRISQLCQDGRIPGAYKPSNRLWLIPADADKPLDLRRNTKATKEIT